MNGAVTSPIRRSIWREGVDVAPPAAGCSLASCSARFSVGRDAEEMFS